MKLSNYGWQLWNSSFLIKFDKLCVSNLTCIVIKQISNLEPILWPIRQNSSKILKTNECMGDNNHNSTISWPLFIQRRKELSSHVRYVLRRQNYHLILIATPFFPLSHLQSLGHLRRSWHSKKKNSTPLSYTVFIFIRDRFLSHLRLSSRTTTVRPSYNRAIKVWSSPVARTTSIRRYLRVHGLKENGVVRNLPGWMRMARSISEWYYHVFALRNKWYTQNWTRPPSTGSPLSRRYGSWSVCIIFTLRVKMFKVYANNEEI